MVKKEEIVLFTALFVWFAKKTHILKKNMNEEEMAWPSVREENWNGRRPVDDNGHLSEHGLWCKW